jgi:hypothetical protein
MRKTYTLTAAGITAAALALALAAWAGAQDGAGKAAGDRAGWKPLFDGKSLAGWKSANFGGEGEVHVEGGAIVMERGSPMTGATYARDDFPKTDYEVAFEARRLRGNDFFCTTTFPVGDAHCSLVVGGWAGAVVGLSSLDGRDASENETKSLRDFKNDHWYRVRIRVTAGRITAWIDKAKVVDVATKGKKISIRPECDLCRPFGLATYRTVGAVRDVKVRLLTSDEKKTAGEKG